MSVCEKLNMEGKEVRDVHLPDPIFDIQERATHTINTFTRKMETNYYKKKLMEGQKKHRIHSIYILTTRC